MSHPARRGLESQRLLEDNARLETMSKQASTHRVDVWGVCVHSRAVPCGIWSGEAAKACALLAGALAYPVALSAGKGPLEPPWTRVWTRGAVLPVLV